MENVKYEAQRFRIFSTFDENLISILDRVNIIHVAVESRNE